MLLLWSQHHNLCLTGKTLLWYIISQSLNSIDDLNKIPWKKMSMFYFWKMSNYSGFKCASRSPEISCDSDMNLHFLSFDLTTAYLSDRWVIGNSSRDVPNIIGNKMWGVLQYYHPLHRLLISVTEQIAAVVTHGKETHVRWQHWRGEHTWLLKGGACVVPSRVTGPLTPKMCMHIEISISLVIRSQPVTVKPHVELQEKKKKSHVKGSH